MSQGAFLAEVSNPKFTAVRESAEPLLTPYRMGDLDLPNRVTIDRNATTSYKTRN